MQRLGVMLEFLSNEASFIEKIYIDFESCIVCSGVLVALSVHAVYKPKLLEQSEKKI
jgi:hypothetical protein